MWLSFTLCYCCWAISGAFSYFTSGFWLTNESLCLKVISPPLQIILKMSLVCTKFSFHSKLTSEWNHPFPCVPGLNNKSVRSSTLGNNFSFTYLFQKSHWETKNNPNCNTEKAGNTFCHQGLWKKHSRTWTDWFCSCSFWLSDQVQAAVFLIY